MNFFKRDAVDRWLWKELQKSGLGGLISYTKTVGILHDIRMFMENETEGLKSITTNK